MLTFPIRTAAAASSRGGASAAGTVDRVPIAVAGAAIPTPFWTDAAEAI